MERFEPPHVPNSLETQTGFYMTGLVAGKVQYGLLRKDDNILQLKKNYKNNTYILMKEQTRQRCRMS